MIRIFLFLSLLCFSITAQAASWIINPNKSSLTFSGQHAGKDFKGTFKEWTGDITFDPNDLSKSNITVLIPVNTAITGDTLYDKTLPQPEWFDSVTNPTAVFTSTRIEKADKENFYKIFGDLKLKDKKIPVNFTTQIIITGDTANVTASTSLDRSQFDIGMASDPKFEWVSQMVKIEINLTATQKN